MVKARNFVVLIYFSDHRGALGLIYEYLSMSEDNFFGKTLPRTISHESDM